MKICRHCGTENADDAVFCQNCGAKLTEADNASPEAGSQKTEQSPLPFENHSETQTNQAQAQASQPQNQTNQTQTQTNQAQSQTSQPWDQANQAQGQASQPWGQANQAQGQASANQTFQKHKKPIIGVICAACAAIVCLLLFLFMPRTINLNKYVKVKTNGYDGYGTATVDLDTDKLEKDFVGKIKLTSAGKQLMKQYQGYMDLADLFDDSSDVKGSKEEKMALAIVEEYLYDDTPVGLSKTSSLSNGQSVQCKFSKDLKTNSEKLSKYCRVRIKYKNFDYKVSGLKKVKKKDLNLNLTFEGMNGNGSINWDDVPEEISYFDIDNEDDLSNGDKVTLTLKDGVQNDFIKNFGYLPKKQSYTFEVSGLESYLGSLSDLKDDRLAALQKQAQDEITSEFASDSDETVSDLKYAGAYLLVNKDDDGWYSHNRLYIVYSATVSSADGSFNPTTDYLPVRFENVTDGSENLSGDIYGNSEISTTDGWGTYIYGYTDGAKMYNDIISQNVDDWNYEVSDGLKGFGE